MATYNLGQAAIVSKGAWSSATTYAILNTVSHNGGTFMAVAPNTNKEPGAASDWQTYWVATARGIMGITVTEIEDGLARVQVTLSDGEVIAGGTYHVNAVAAGGIDTTQLAPDAVTTEKIGNGQVTAAKLAPDILPSNVGIKYGTAVPTTADISEGQIYLKYS